MLVNTRTGQFEIPGEQDLISRSLQNYGEWAQQEIDMLATFIHDNDIVVDAGAFIGTHARAFSELVGPGGQVHAFEPNRRILPFLQSNARSAHFANIIVHDFGLGETTEAKRFIFENDNLGASHAVEGVVDSDDSIMIQRLDDVGLDDVSFIKADVEGMEISLLNGAQALIKRCRPVIYLELNTLSIGIESLAWARQNNYFVHGLAANPFNPENLNRQPDNIFGEAMELGLVLIPDEHQEKYLADIANLGLPALCSYDDLALLLLLKPQYASEWLAHSPIYHKRIGEIREQCALIEQAKTYAESLALQRFGELEALTRRLALTEEAKAQAESLALQRFGELEALTRRLALTEEAKAYAESLAFQRLDELEALTRQRDEERDAAQPKLAMSEQARQRAEHDNAVLRNQLRMIQSSQLWRLGNRLGIVPDLKTDD